MNALKTFNFSEFIRTYITPKRNLLKTYCSFDQYHDVIFIIEGDIFVTSRNILLESAVILFKCRSGILELMIF